MITRLIRCGRRPRGILVHCKLICKTKRLKLANVPALPKFSGVSKRHYIENMRTLKRYLLLAITLSAVLFGFACTSEPTAPANAVNSNANTTTIGKRGGTLTYRITSPVKTLNYFMADDEVTVIATMFLMNDRLVGLDHKDQKYIPLLAESYTVAADGRTVDIVLREGLKFSDGKPLTTADVDFSLRAVYDERTNSPVFRDSLLVGGKGIESRIIDERRIQLVLPEVVALPENYLENLAILPKHALDADFRSGKLSESWKITNDPAAVVTSGPFMVDSVQAGERVSLKRNPNYWRKDEAGNQLPYLDALLLEVVSDPNNALARLNQSTLDVVDRIRTSDYASLRNSTGPVKAFDVGPGQASDYMWFNLNPAKKNGEKLEGTPKHTWFSDKRFRQAVSHAIDRKSIAANTLQGLATPLYGFVPAGNKLWIDNDLKKTEYDLERSRSLLSEAGFTIRDNGGKNELFDAAGNRVEFTLIVPAENEPRKLMAAVVQEDLAKLGIAVQVVPLDFQSLTERWSSSLDYDAILSGSSLTALDPSSYAGLLQSGAAQHQWRPKQDKPATDWEARIDQLYSEQASERDPTVRKQKFNEIQSIMAEEMPTIPIVSRHIVSAANERVGNVSPSTILPFSLWNADRLFIK